MCSDFWAEGRAMVTMEASSTTISWATAMTARAAQRLGSASRGLRCIGGSIESITVVMGSPRGVEGRQKWEYGCPGGGRNSVDAEVTDRSVGGPPTRRWCG